MFFKMIRHAEALDKKITLTTKYFVKVMGSEAVDVHL